MLSSFLIALQFLTRAPVHPSYGDDPEAALRRATSYFPLAGALIGVVSWLVFAGLVEVATPWVAAALLITFQTLLTGALHWDAVCDCADGLVGGRDRDSVLEIMRDPRAGAFGVTAIACVMLLKWSALASIAQSDLGLACLLAPVIGRSAMLVALRLPSARNTGLARTLSQAPPVWVVWITGLGVSCVTALALGYRGAGGLTLAMLAAGGLLLLAWIRLRGVTGDVCGAAGELAETAFLTGVTLHGFGLETPPSWLAV